MIKNKKLEEIRERIAKKTLENNKLIALFMGWEESIYDNLPNKVYKYKEEIGIPLNQLQYNELWNLLMPVVDKIETTDNYRFTVGIETDRCIIFDRSIEVEDVGTGKDILFSSHLQGEKIIATYKAVIEFIKWYNINK